MMNSIRAVVVDPDAPGRLAIRPVDPPIPAPTEALVQVAAFSLNLGEVRGSTTAEPGWRPGWDLAGTVVQAAPDGSGPPAGARVVGLLRSGAWAEVVAVPTQALAVLPRSVSFAQAATLPVAGLTALYALECGGLLLGRPVLITGASGGVGHFACQLARDAGARVVAAVRRPEREALAREAGAHDVVVGEELTEAAAFGPFPLILESVGGKILTTALTLLAPGGICVLYGTSAGSEVTFNASRFFVTGGACLYGFILFHEARFKPPSEGLARLAAMLTEGRIRTHIDLEAPWADVARLSQQMLDRRIAGKAVLHITAA